MNDCFLMAFALNDIESKCPEAKVEIKSLGGVSYTQCTLVLIVGKAAVGRLLFSIAAGAASGD